VSRALQVTRARARARAHAHTHTHTHTQLYGAQTRPSANDAHTDTPPPRPQLPPTAVTACRFDAQTRPTAADARKLDFVKSFDEAEHTKWLEERWIEETSKPGAKIIEDE
jgi:hypothetical protein